MILFRVNLPGRPSVIASAERWFDVRKWASIQFPDHTDVELINDASAPIDFEIRWIGREQDQKMQVRATGGEWEAA